MAIRYHYDLYPRTSPRDGARIRRFTKLQRAMYRDVIGVGSGAADIRSTDAEAADLDPLGEQYIRVVREDTTAETELVVAGFWINRFNHDTAVARETKRLTFSGAGHLAYLARARMWSHTYMGAAGAGVGITTGAQDPFDDIWRLWNQGDWAGGDYLGAVFHRVIMEALSYQSGAYTHRHKDGEFYTDTHADDRTGGSAISLITLGFDKDDDSDGNPWSVPSGEFQASVGENVLSVTQRLMQAGLYVELDPDTFELRAWENDEHRRDRTGSAWGANVVRFQAPTDATVDTGNMLSDSEREINSHLKRTIMLAGGQDSYAKATAAGDIRWEGFEPSTAAESAALSQLASTQITARSEAADAGSVRMKLGVTPLSGRYRPWEEVRLDDLVTVHTGTGEWDYDEATYPVAGLKIELQKSGAWWAWAELGASFSPGADRRFQVPPVPAHTHPLPLCTPFLPSDATVTGRLYYTNGDDVGSGLTASDYAADWDLSNLAQVKKLRTTPQSTLGNSGTGNPWAAVNQAAQKVVTDLFSFPLSDSANVLAAVQAGGEFRTVIRSDNRDGIGVDEAAQANYMAIVGRVYRPGTGFIGTLFDTSDATSDVRFDVSPGSPFPSIPLSAPSAAVPSAVGTDYLVIDLGGDHVTPVTGATGFSYRPADSSVEDLPYIVDSVADQNSWLEFSTAGGGGTGDGHVDLVGTAMRAKRCDDTEHWHDSREPTVFDDSSVGMRVGTLWLDDTTGRVWWLTDNTAGAAVWILITDPSSGGGGGGTTLTIEEEDGSPSGTFDTLKVPDTTLTDNGDGSASLAVAAAVHSHVPPSGDGFRGVLLRRTTNFTSTNANTSIPDFDTVIYDTDSFYDAGDPERITIPADFDGLMFQFYASGLWATSTDNYVELKLYRNGTGVEEPVAVTQMPPATAYNTAPILISAPVQVATGDYFTITFRTPASETVLTYDDMSLVFGAWLIGGGGGSGSVTEEEVRDAGRWEVIVAGTAPPVAVSNPDDDDWLYGWVSG
jgi:hypothetical protein